MRTRYSEGQICPRIYGICIYSTCRHTGESTCIGGREVEGAGEGEGFIQANVKVVGGGNLEGLFKL